MDDEYAIRDELRDDAVVNVRLNRGDGEVGPMLHPLGARRAQSARDGDLLEVAPGWFQHEFLSEAANRSCSDPAT
jgi:hypothetical protein